MTNLPLTVSSQMLDKDTTVLQVAVDALGSTQVSPYFQSQCRRHEQLLKHSQITWHETIHNVQHRIYLPKAADNYPKDSPPGK